MTQQLTRILLFIVLVIRMGLSNEILAAGEATVWLGMSRPAHGEREGIYRATLNMKTGAISTPAVAAEIGEPEFLALHPGGTHLYAACQLPDGKPAVAAFEISNDKKSLTLLNTEPINDGGACHIATDNTGRCLFTAQYGTGTVAAFPLEADGRIRPRSALIRQSGTGPNKARQEGPHPHWVGADPADRFLFVPDLGADKIFIYEMDLAAGTLKPHGHGTCPPGSGPRHMAFHPNGKFAYVVNEMGVTVTAFAYDANAGTLTALETVDSLPEKDREIPSTAAELCMHPSGEFLYASTRDHDTISAFRVDPNTGRLKFVEREPIRGSHPRSFGLDPTGNWLLAAGRDSNTVSVFHIDPKTGSLVYNETITNAPQPICVLIQAAK
ncbi:MAG: lactonase family protein [Pirellulales bacterium]